MQHITKASQARWAALVKDQVVPMPRRILTALTIKEQAGVPSDLLLIRDFQSPVDVVLQDDDEVDLAQGNVFRTIPRCDASAGCTAPNALPKLAFFVNDSFEITVEPKQTEASLRRLFDLLPKVQLLRDLESPNDQPVGTNEAVLFENGPVFVTCVEIEKHCGSEQPPSAQRYIIRVGDKRIVMASPKVTGRQILIAAGLNPAENMLNQKIGKRFQPVGLDEIVDLTGCGIERFTTLPNEQSEGRPQFRRQFTLPEEDVELLDGSGLAWETVTEPSGKWLIIHNIALPAELGGGETSAAMQITPGYPSAALDMAYFNPPIRRVDGKAIPCTESSQPLVGLSWQRWSRHYTSANPWKVGEFNVFTHYLLCRSWLEREARKGKS